MIVFITSVRHPYNCKSYDYILQLLEKSLRSVCNQSDQNFKVIVVSNTDININFFHTNIECVVVNFPPPSADRTPRTGLDVVRRDKGAKYAVGISAAKKYDPEYIMFFDADDFVSKNISEFCNKNLKQNGWFIETGYIYKDNGVLCEKTRCFNKICGTSNILNYELIKMPDCVDVTLSIDSVIESVDNYFLTHILASHPFTVDYFFSKGYPLKPLPFPGAVYVIGTGENHSGRVLFNSRPQMLAKDIVAEFGMDLECSFGQKLKQFSWEYPLENYRIVRYRLFPRLFDIIKKCFLLL